MEEVPAEELVNPSAYILFYIRKDMARLSFPEVYPMLDKLTARGKDGGLMGFTAGGKEEEMRAHSMTEEEMDKYLKRRDTPSKCNVM